MSGVDQSLSKEELWGGGRSPFGVSYGKMMMWYFLVSDALTFGGLLVAYGVSRASNLETWPIGEQVFQALPGLDGSYPLIYVALMTFILIVSSVTMVLAVEAGHRNDKKGVIRWLGLTIIGGFFFLGSQAWEWSHFIHGSGGHYGLNTPVTIAYTDDDGESQNYTIGPEDHVFMDHHFGVTLGHYMEHGFFHDEDAHGTGGHGHDDHAHGDGAAHDGEHTSDNHGEHSDGAAHASGHGDDSHDEHHEHVLEELEHLGISEERLMEITHTSSVHAALEAAAEKEHHGEKIFLAYAKPSALEINKYVENYIELTAENNAAEIDKLWNDKVVEEGTFFFGANLENNEYGPQHYADFFFFVTGFHGFHVFSGVLINIIVFFMVVKGVFEKRKHYEMVEKIGLYWHFVDLVWVFVFTFFYLI